MQLGSAEAAGARADGMLLSLRQRTQPAGHGCALTGCAPLARFLSLAQTREMRWRTLARA